MIIPADKLSPDALDGLIEEYITREGTDYGMEEVDLMTKLRQIKQQIKAQEVLIVFDAYNDSTSLMTKIVYQRWQKDNPI